MDEHALRGGSSPGGPLSFREASGTYVVVAVMLAATMVALLWVPSYAKVSPTLGGFPFFYWYSLLWLVLNALLQIGAYRLLVVRTRRRRGAGSRRDDGARS